ncbi:MAG TPA: LuxR C-terminal-related transcriptional regulator [Acidobacteriaceae bacterium]|jgi:DNA-binding NarL/FixJ family response regulator|nr:LuxR C-terminal-related transcriptional regulator [Acidobacteriaceae bacterium]
MTASKRLPDDKCREVMNAIPVYIWSALRDGTVDFVNPQWEQFTGLPASAAHINTDDLSTRELEVPRSIAGGNSNKAVASNLGISEDTVKGHVRNALVKLHANDRTHAVMIALERGYFDIRK